MKLEKWDMVIEGGNDFTSKNYNQWKAAVLKINDMAEYRLCKLWRLNFTPGDIARDKHHAIFPPSKAARVRSVIGRTEDQGRGARIGAKKKQWLYARALRDAAEGILLYHALDSAMRAETAKELQSFKELMKKFAHKSGAA